MPSQPSHNYLVTYRDESTWGKNAWLSYSDFEINNAHDVAAFFTEISASEIARGVDNFYVEVLANNSDQLNEWFKLGFEIQHVSAILNNFKSYPNTSDVLLRTPVEADLVAMAHLERELSIYQQGSPVFSMKEPEPLAEIIDGWREDLSNDEFVKYVAEVNQEVVGFAYGCSTEKSKLHSGLLRPKNSATFAFCTIDPSYRGRGIGKQLATRVIEALFESGYENIVTDWRATNPLASHTWPKLGFLPTMYRLHLKIS